MVFIRFARKNGRSAFCVNKGLPISIEPFTAYSHSKIGPSAISAAIRSPGANVLLNPFIYITWPSLSKLLIGAGL